MSTKKEVTKGQGRHSLSTIGGLIVGAGVADTEVVQSVRTLMEQANISPDIQALIGFVILGIAHVLSMLDKRKRGRQND